MDYSRKISERLWNKKRSCSHSKQRSDFLDFCHDYDANPFVCGMGKDNLFARGKI